MKTMKSGNGVRRSEIGRRRRLARKFVAKMLTPHESQPGERLAIMRGGRDLGGWGPDALHAHAMQLMREVCPEEESGGFAERVRAVLGDVGDMLIAKNKAYGDSALNPVGIFARGNAEDLIRVRIDDKLSRIRNAPEAFGEDAVMDLLGYLVLFKLARKG